MNTNIAADEALVEQAKRAGGHENGRQAVEAALKQYIRRHQRLGIKELFGTIEYDPTYDYKAERKRARG